MSFYNCELWFDLGEPIATNTSLSLSFLSGIDHIRGVFGPDDGL